MNSDNDYKDKLQINNQKLFNNKESAVYRRCGRSDSGHAGGRPAQWPSGRVGLQVVTDGIGYQSLSVCPLPLHAGAALLRALREGKRPSGVI